jgi:hypothetical protein
VTWITAGNPIVSRVSPGLYYDLVNSFLMKGLSMSRDAGFRASRLAEQKQRARRVRIGVMIVLCALPVAMALAHPVVMTLVRGSAL